MDPETAQRISPWGAWANSPCSPQTLLAIDFLTTRGLSFLAMAMSKEQIERLFEEHGVILKGHFLLASGLHSDLYFEKFRILENPELTETIVTAMSDKLRELKPELVVGPTTGGVLVA